jgi:hypothetical protein
MKHVTRKLGTESLGKIIPDLQVDSKLLSGFPRAINRIPDSKIASPCTCNTPAIDTVLLITRHISKSVLLTSCQYSHCKRTWNLYLLLYIFLVSTIIHVYYYSIWNTATNRPTFVHCCELEHAKLVLTETLEQRRAVYKPTIKENLSLFHFTKKYT